MAQMRDSDCMNPVEIAILINAAVLLGLSLLGLYYAYKGTEILSYTMIYN